MVTTGELQLHEERLLVYFFMLRCTRNDLKRISAVLTPADFYNTFNGDVYATMLKMADESKNDDEDTWRNYLLIAERLCNNPIDARFRNWSLSEAVARLQTMCDTSADIYSLAALHQVAILLRDEAQQRTIRAAMMTALDATSNDEFLNSLDDVRSRMTGYTRRTRMVNTLWDCLETWKEDCERAQSGRAVNLGWPTIDKAFGLIRGGEVVILAARAGVGKTWGAGSVAVHNAMKDRKVLLCTLEQPGSEMAERIMAQSLNLAPRDMRISHENLRVNDAREHLPHLDNILIYDQTITVNQIESIVKKCMVDGFTPDMVVIDYLGLLQWEGKPVSQYERASETARQLKHAAKRINLPILALAQLSREAGDGSTEPFMDMLRDSGAIEEAADRILMMWKAASGVYVKVAKNRHGPDKACAILRYSNGMRMEETYATGSERP